MEKRKLADNLNGFTNNNSLSVELFFVFKNQENVYQLYSTNTDEKLKKELIESYTKELVKYNNQHSPFEVHSIFNDNENNWNYIYYDKLGSTKIATDIFSVNEELVVDNIEQYTSEVGDYSSIFGFVIDLYSREANDTIRIFKKAMPTQAMKQNKVFGISLGEGGRFKTADKDMVFFQKDIDIFKVKDKLYIKKYNVYETNFKFDEVLKRRLIDSLNLLLKVPCLEFSENAKEHISNLTNIKRKKLINCVVDNKILSEEKHKSIRSQAKRYLKHEYKTTSPERIYIDTKKDVNNLITILNREINKNSATNEVFHTPTKKLLGVYSKKK